MESASSRVIATNGAALRIAEGGTREPALIFLHYWGGSPICRSRGGGMMSVAVPLDRLDERGESRKETEESQATGWRLSTRGFLLSTFSPLLSVCRRQIGATGDRHFLTSSRARSCSGAYCRNPLPLWQ